VAHTCIWLFVFISISTSKWRYPFRSVSHLPGFHYNSLYTTNIYLCPPLLSFFPTVRCIKRPFGSTMASTRVHWSKETVSLHRWRKPRIMGWGVTQRIRTICKVRNNCIGPISALQPWLVLGKWHYMSVTGQVIWIQTDQATERNGRSFPQDVPFKVYCAAFASCIWDLKKWSTAIKSSEMWKKHDYARRCLGLQCNLIQ